MQGARKISTLKAFAVYHTIRDMINKMLSLFIAPRICDDSLSFKAMQTEGLRARVFQTYPLEFDRTKYNVNNGY